ncbi:MAG: type II toxin-antitoxin system RelE/ParE family toxin [Actinobacteria bacterium]|nr:type II toxin-antitoxin system RelE/ParE family toxin [Actinomycetota bacterium]
MEHQLKWRSYRTAGGRAPVTEYLATLDIGDAAEIAAAMTDIRKNGVRVARKLRGDIWEVKANGRHSTYRVLFALEGKGRVLLALDAFAKKTQRTPVKLIELAEDRLADWRTRGVSETRVDAKNQA